MGKGKNYLLYPISRIFGLITGFRNFLYDRGVLSSREFDVPVICTGNITVGGTGKTPHTEYLVSLLRKNFKVAVLSRGYKRRSSGFQVVTPDTMVAIAGDEPLQMARKFPDVVVAVDRNRVSGVEKIMNKYPGTEVIILDDGFQHRRIKPGFSILISDFGRLMTRDQLMPLGNLRESLSNIIRADLIIISKSPENLLPLHKEQISREIRSSARQRVFFTSFVYKDPVPLFEGSPAIRLSDLTDTGILLVTGIANPAPLIDFLKDRTGGLKHLRFPDHQNYSARDIEKIIAARDEMHYVKKIILTTEKDAVRLMEFANIAPPVRSSMYYLPVEVCLEDSDRVEFENIITEYAGANKRNS
ncbi:MAG: tetraacyldisaccharide 4'-kinase [Bacteroidales bacterium]|nr:tetraacyldisaccharide 4'-kinase [Bacteroidales bacterium]